MNVKALFLLLILPFQGVAQGYAGLGSEATGFANPQPEYQMEFPQDHTAHPDFRIEWWYVTANLTDPAGNPVGLQWTLFRQATQAGPQPDGWENPQIWMGHAGLTLSDHHFSAETFARGGIGQAGVNASPFQAYIDDWSMVSKNDGLDQITLTASGFDFSYRMQLVAQGPLVLHGENGFSRKSDQGQASHYYSQPFYEISGEITANGETIPVKGSAWLDREWSSQPLSADQHGWDWFSLHLDSGAKLMAFRLRGDSNYISGTWIEADGTTTPLANNAVQFTPLKTHNVEGRNIPTSWRIKLPERGLDVEVEAINTEAFMNTLFPYWEGPIQLSGSHTGVGYLEMTGY